MRALLTLSLSSLVFVCVLSPAQAVPTDFDGDSRSDLTLVKIQDDKSLLWQMISSSTGTLAALGGFGVAGNHLIPAKWRGASMPMIGVVANNKGNITWMIVDEQGQKQDRLFGIRDDLLVSGADFDGNGYADAAIVRLVKAKARWQIKFNLFENLALDPAATELYFGKNGDRVFFASLNGTQDELAIVRRAKGSKRSLVQYKNLVTGQVHKISRFPAAFSAPPRPRPFAVRQQSGADLVAVTKTSGKNTRGYFYTWNGALVRQATLPGTGTVVVGDFLAEPGEEVAIQTGTGFSILNPVSGSSTAISAPKGIPVDLININSFKSSDSDSGGSGGNSSTPSGGGGGAGCESVASWPGSHIYKTIGSSHFSDVRRNTIGVVVRPGGSGPFPSCISVLDTRGNQLAQLGLYSRGDGWEARYYAGIGCGASTPYNGSAIGSKARANTGSSQVLFNFGSVCYGPIDATRCIGSSQC